MSISRAHTVTPIRHHRGAGARAGAGQQHLTEVQVNIAITANRGYVVFLDLPGIFGVARLLTRVQGAHAHWVRPHAACEMILHTLAGNQPVWRSYVRLKGPLTCNPEVRCLFFRRALHPPP
eukprot:COSAG02_NODE_32946_length_508_cov_0.621027_1_plen_120_part_10